MGDPGGKRPDDNHTIHRPGVAIALLAATALVSVAAVVINLGGGVALIAIAATLTIASALTLIVFHATRGRRR
jgi:hypothetical protein